MTVSFYYVVIWSKRHDSGYDTDTGRMWRHSQSEAGGGDASFYLPLFGISPMDSETSVAMVSGCLEKRSDVCGRVTVFGLAD